jgi:RNA polymerase sigma factor (sigma-70 family)
MSQPLCTVNSQELAHHALASFCVRFDQGKFPELTNSDALWWLLARMTCNKVADAFRRRYARYQQGKVNRVPNAEEEFAILSELVTTEPDPTCVVEVRELFEKLQALLSDRQRRIIAWRVQDWPVREIAQELRVSQSTVEEECRTIRKKWDTFAKAEKLDGLFPA